MRVKSRVLVGLIVLIVLVSGVSLVKRLSQEKDLWRPSDVYKSVGIHRRSTFSTVSSAPASYSEAVATVSSGSGSMFRHSGASFHAPVSGFAYSQSPMAGTASYSQRLHTTSSAEIRSFGGGGNGGGVSMSGGAVQSSGSSVASSAGLSVSMPSTSVLAVNNTRNNSSVNDVMSSVSGDIAMASSQAYAGIGNTTKGVAGRKNVPGIGGEWTGWLDTEWSGGSNDITFDMLKDLYARMTGDTDFSNQELWDAFLAWFEGNQSNDKFGWYWAPISDAVPFVLLLCLVYAFVIYRKTKMAKNVKAEK
jgi:hypothetical protein